MPGRSPLAPSRGTPKLCSEAGCRPLRQGSRALPALVSSSQHLCAVSLVTVKSQEVTGSSNVTSQPTWQGQPRNPSSTFQLWLVRLQTSSHSQVKTSPLLSPGQLGISSFTRAGMPHIRISQQTNWKTPADHRAQVGENHRISSRRTKGADSLGKTPEQGSDRLASPAPWEVRKERRVKEWGGAGKMSRNLGGNKEAP